MNVVCVHAHVCVLVYYACISQCVFKLWKSHLLGWLSQVLDRKNLGTHINIPLSPYKRWYSSCYIETPSVQVTTLAKRIYGNYGYINWTTTISYNNNHHLHIHRCTTTTTDHPPPHSASCSSTSRVFALVAGNILWVSQGQEVPDLIPMVPQA